MSIEKEKSQPYQHAYFSVVRHPDNSALDNSIKEYKLLINNNPKFSEFTSKNVIGSAIKLNDDILNEWVNWYSDLYDIK